MIGKIETMRGNIIIGPPLKEFSNSVYQSGQEVEIAGYYEMVGDNSRPDTNLNRRSLHELHTEERFPNYDGRAVCWYLISPINTPPKPISPCNPQLHNAPLDNFVEYMAGLTG